MSWSDTCGNCGEHKADCGCKYYACVTSHTCKYCKNDCDKKQKGECEHFELAKKRYNEPLEYNVKLQVEEIIEEQANYLFPLYKPVDDGCKYPMP